MEIGGIQVNLDPAAISCIRYRIAYGNSIVNDLAACTSADDEEAVLLRMIHAMLAQENSPDLLEFARQARRDPDFLVKGRVARSALLALDSNFYVSDNAPTGNEPFDEYKILAMMVVAGIDMELIYQLPILHLVSLASRVAQLRDPEARSYRPMTNEELVQLYPRRR